MKAIICLQAVGLAEVGQVMPSALKNTKFYLAQISEVLSSNYQVLIYEFHPKYMQSLDVFKWTYI